MTVALVAGAMCVSAQVAGAQTSSSRAAQQGAQQNGNVLVIPAQPTVRSRVSQWLSSWRANGGEVKGEAANARAAQAEQPKAKKPRRTASKKATRSTRKAKQQQVASRPAKKTQRAAEPSDTNAPATATSAAVPAAAGAAPVAAAPAAAPPDPTQQTSVQVAPAYAAPPEVRRVPPSQTLHSPLADIPPVTLFVPPAVAGALTAAPADAAAAAPGVLAALPPPAILPEPKPAAPEPPLPPATSRIHKQPDAVDEATWWRTEGEPAIVNFRDCIAAYAGREAPRRPQTSLGDLVIEAGAGDCRAPFEDMMTTLTVRYGRERLETAMGAILNETLLPAARTAAEDAARSSAASQPSP